jgi:disulfide bond formation protein DsbB
MDMKVKMSLTRRVCVAVGAATAFSIATCVTTVLMSDLSVLPWGDRVTGPRQVLAEDLADWPEDVAPAVDGSHHAMTTAAGQAQYLQSCATCHGANGQGMPHQGPSLLDSTFVSGTADAELADFLKRGRLPTEPGSVMRLYMPPRGGNPSLSDDDLSDIVKHMRRLRHNANDTTAALPPGWSPG